MQFNIIEFYWEKGNDFIKVTVYDDAHQTDLEANVTA